MFYLKHLPCSGHKKTTVLTKQLLATLHAVSYEKTWYLLYMFIIVLVAAFRQGIATVLWGWRGKIFSDEELSSDYSQRGIMSYHLGE